MAERGVEAAARLAEVIAGRLRPTAAFRKPPLLPPLGSQGTARGPMRRLYDLADEMEKDPGVISISIFAGFPLADIPDAGLGIYVVTDDDQALADALADELARGRVGAPARVHAHRACRCTTRWRARSPPTAGPIVLADMADNTGGGAAGDGTEILRELLRVGARSAVVACLWDPAAVARLREGRRRRHRHARRRRQGRRRATARPLTRHRRACARCPTAASSTRGPMMRGLPGRLGTTAVLDVNDVKVILISHRWQTLDPEMIRFVGIDPLEREDPRRQVDHPLPRGLRADRAGDHRGRRARAVVVQPRRASPSRACGGPSSRSTRRLP